MPLQYHTRSLGFYFKSLASIFYVKDVNNISLRPDCQIFAIVTEWNFSSRAVTFVWVGSLTDELWKIVNLDQRVVWCKSHLTIVGWKCKVIDSGAVTLNKSLRDWLKILSVQEKDGASGISKMKKKSTLLLRRGTMSWIGPIQFHRDPFDWLFWGW